MAVYEIPLRGGTAQTFSVLLAGVLYGFALDWIDEDEGGWVLDIADADGAPIITGIALLPGQDLLAPCPDLGIAVRLFVLTPGEPEARPTFAGLGTASRLLFEATA